MKWPDEVFAVKSRKGPAPHGAGGLKSQALCLMQPGSGSRPARGGWIEISSSGSPTARIVVPPRMGRVDAYLR